MSKTSNTGGVNGRQNPAPTSTPPKSTPPEEKPPGAVSGRAGRRCAGAVLVEDGPWTVSGVPAEGLPVAVPEETRQGVTAEAEALSGELSDCGGLGAVPAETGLGVVVCGGLGLEGFQQSLVDVGLETSFDPLDGDLRMYMDQVFRSVMTKQTPQAKAGLQGLLGALIGQDIVDLQVIDSELPVDSIFEKRSRFDVVVTFNNGQQANIEMCCYTHNYHQERMELYAAKLHAGQPLKGQLYSRIKRTYQISIIANQNIYPHDTDLCHEFALYDQQRDTAYQGRVKLITVELHKLKELFATDFKIDSLDSIQRWALFLAYGQDRAKQDLMRELCELEEAINMSAQTLNSISKDEIERYRLFQQWANNLETQSLIPDAIQTGIEQGHAQGLAEGLQQGKAEGLAEGLEKGKAQGLAQGMTEGKTEGLAEGLAEGDVAARRDVARKMLFSGLGIEAIQELTSLTKTDIENLN